MAEGGTGEGRERAGEAHERGGRTHVLRTCFIDDHDGISGRFTACLAGFGGTVIFLAGLLSVVSAVAPDVPVVPLGVVRVRPPDVLAAGDFLTGVGAIAVGLTLLGRKRLADRLTKTGGQVKNTYLGGGDDS